MDPNQKNLQEVAEENARFWREETDRRNEWLNQLKAKPIRHRIEFIDQAATLLSDYLVCVSELPCSLRLIESLPKRRRERLVLHDEWKEVAPYPEFPFLRPLEDYRFTRDHWFVDRVYSMPKFSVLFQELKLFGTRLDVASCCTAIHAFLESDRELKRLVNEAAGNQIQTPLVLPNPCCFTAADSESSTPTSNIGLVISLAYWLDALAWNIRHVEERTLQDSKYLTATPVPAFKSWNSIATCAPDYRLSPDYWEELAFSVKIEIEILYELAEPVNRSIEEPISTRGRKPSTPIRAGEAYTKMVESLPPKERNEIKQKWEIRGEAFKKAMQSPEVQSSLDELHRVFEEGKKELIELGIPPEHAALRTEEDIFAVGALVGIDFETLLSGEFTEAQLWTYVKNKQLAKRTDQGGIAVPSAPNPSQITPDVDALEMEAIEARRTTGQSWEKIQQKYGVSRSTIERRAKSLGIELPKQKPGRKSVQSVQNEVD
jgi:hypothetical protein